MNNNKSIKATRGGGGRGAGRKCVSKAGNTKPVRVPLIYNGILKELISYLDNSCDTELKDDELKSEPFKFISADKKEQTITFTIKNKVTN
jgi:hypothetical protein